MNIMTVAMGVAFALMWSSAFATARIIVAAAPPLMALSVRFLISGAVALIIARVMGQKLWPAGGWRGRQMRAILIFGLCQNALYLGLNFIAMQWIEASLAAIIASTMPLIVAALGWAFWRQKVAPLGLAGLVLGMIGVALIMGTRVQGGADPMGIILCVIGATALAVATLTVQGASAAGGSLLAVVGLQMLVGSASLGLVSAMIETPHVTLGLPLVLAFLYQTFVPGLAATLLWFALVGRIGPVRGATFHFLNPFFGVLIAALLLGEKIAPTDIIGVGVVMIGILAVQIAKVQRS